MQMETGCGLNLSVYLLLQGSGVNFINILRFLLRVQIPKAQKYTGGVTVFLCFWDTKHKTACKHVGKIDPNNFTNIIREDFCYIIVLQSFYVLTVSVCIYLAKEYWRKSYP